MQTSRRNQCGCQAWRLREIIGTTLFKDQMAPCGGGTSARENLNVKYTSTYGQPLSASHEPTHKVRDDLSRPAGTAEQRPMARCRPAGSCPATSGTASALSHVARQRSKGSLAADPHPRSGSSERFSRATKLRTSSRHTADEIAAYPYAESCGASSLAPVPPPQVIQRNEVGAKRQREPSWPPRPARPARYTVRCRLTS